MRTLKGYLEMDYALNLSKDAASYFRLKAYID